MVWGWIASTKNVEYGHNGNHKGHEYFKCDNQYDIYIPEDKIIKYSIDALIQSVLNARNSDSYCPNRNDVKICALIWRLVRCFIHYPIKYAFSFSELVIHDRQSQISKCKSLVRRDKIKRRSKRSK